MAHAFDRGTGEAEVSLMPLLIFFFQAAVQRLDNSRWTIRFDLWDIIFRPSLQRWSCRVGAPCLNCDINSLCCALPAMRHHARCSWRGWHLHKDFDMAPKWNVLQSLFWKVLETLLGGPLLEEVSHWGRAFKGHTWTLVSSLSLFLSAFCLVGGG